MTLLFSQALILSENATTFSGNRSLRIHPTNENWPRLFLIASFSSPFLMRVRELSALFPRADWGFLHFSEVPDDIQDLDNTFVGDERWRVTARWFYTRAAQAGVDKATGKPFFIIAHRACVGAKINDPRRAPGEDEDAAKEREANTTFCWDDDVPLGHPYRVVIRASRDIQAKRRYQELFTDYGSNYDFSI